MASRLLLQFPIVAGSARHILGQPLAWMAFGNAVTLAVPANASVGSRFF
jgi:ABC-type Co2+ transport system permease subunit